MDAAKEILLYYLEALSDAAEEVAQVGRMRAETEERLGRAHSYVSTLRQDRFVGGYGVTLDPLAPGYPRVMAKPVPRLLTLLNAPVVMLAKPMENRLSFHQNAWNLVDEARFFMQAVDLGWIQVSNPAPMPVAR